VEVDAASAGPARRDGGDVLVAPVAVRIIYARQGGNEVRQSLVACRVTARGRVIALR